MLIHLSFLINNKIVCFHKNIHKTRSDEAQSDPTDNLSQELKCIVDIDIMSSMENVIWIVYTVSITTIAHPINIFKVRDN